MLESGLPKADADSGWLNRAAEVHSADSVAVAHTLPIGLRGKQLAKTWYPDLLRPAKDDLYERLQVLYQDDDLLSGQLRGGLKKSTVVGWC